MVSSRLVCTFSATLLILVIAGSSHAQAPIQSLGIRVIDARGTLTDTQKNQIQSFTNYWCGQLTSTDTTMLQVETARKELIKPLNAVAGPSVVFRFEYSGQVLSRLTPLISGDGSPHTISNAFLIVGELATRRSVDLLIRHSDSRHEKRLYIRILASQNCEKTLAYFSDTLKPREIGLAVRGLRNAAQREDNPTVLSHQLGGIQAIQSPEAMDALLGALEKVVEKIQAPHPEVNPLIRPFSEAIQGMRRDFLNLPGGAGGEKQRISLKLIPVLGAFFSAAMSNWDAAHTDEQFARQYSSSLRLCESLQKMCMRELGRTIPNTDLQKFWDDGVKSSFANDVRNWNGVQGR